MELQQRPECLQFCSKEKGSQPESCVQGDLDKFAASQLLGVTYPQRDIPKQRPTHKDPGSRR